MVGRSKVILRKQVFELFDNIEEVGNYVLVYWIYKPVVSLCTS